MCFPLTIQHHAGGHGTGTRRIICYVSPLGPALRGGPAASTHPTPGFPAVFPESLPAGCWPQGSSSDHRTILWHFAKASGGPRGQHRGGEFTIWVAGLQPGRRETTDSRGRRKGVVIPSLVPHYVPWSIELDVLCAGHPQPRHHSVLELRHTHVTWKKRTHPGLQFVRRGWVELREGEGRGLHLLPG